MEGATDKATSDEGDVGIYPSFSSYDLLTLILYRLSLPCSGTTGVSVCVVVLEEVVKLVDCLLTMRVKRDI